MLQTDPDQNNRTSDEMTRFLAHAICDKTTHLLIATLSLSRGKGNYLYLFSR